MLVVDVCGKEDDCDGEDGKMEDWLLAVATM